MLCERYDDVIIPVVLLEQERNNNILFTGVLILNSIHIA